MRKIVLIAGVIAVLVLSIALGVIYYRNQQNKTDQSHPTPTSTNTGIANPASVYCEEQGGTLEIRDGATGQTGYCIFDDSSECEEWQFYRGECKAGENK